jgi:hypothetical protein
MDAPALLSDAKCFVCLGVSEADAIELALLSQIASVPAITPPVLSFAFPDLHWTFFGTDPAQWSIQESEDGGASWFEVGLVSGVTRSAPFLDSGVLARIVGQIPPIPPSNSVGIP